MTQYMMGRKKVTYVREAQKGDKGYNEAKPRMVVVSLENEGGMTVPSDSLVPIAEPVEEPKKGKGK